ncbi:biliverdin-producing heme oxygenase [Brevundimonas sp.]|uniref:biliverdin-producing heme oxygenase n=1 Tax=Brevundimonas sp. TaxID=1871086 RepID=UPI0025C4E765|nr:biliverdin-producing heme oxygenase [Brevundimonas sp.]
MTDAPMPAQDRSRAKDLKAQTHGTHDRLDKAIMVGNPFGDRDRYGLFLKVQQPFHRDIDALYNDPRLIALLPDLGERRRLTQIEQDIADLRQTVPVATQTPRFTTSEPADLATALGWLYVAEGSNLGAAFLFKMALKLGLSEDFGARHLAGHPDGRAAHWRRFTSALDAIELDADQEMAMVAGANAAFGRVHALVQEAFR